MDVLLHRARRLHGRGAGLKSRRQSGLGTGCDLIAADGSAFRHRLPVVDVAVEGGGQTVDARLQDAGLVLHVDVQMRLRTVPAVAAQADPLPGLQMIACLDPNAPGLHMGHQQVFAVPEVEQDVVAGGMVGVHDADRVVRQAVLGLDDGARGRSEEAFAVGVVVRETRSVPGVR